MTDNNAQYQKDIQSIIAYLKINHPERATYEHAVELYKDMKANAHLLAHEIVNAENSGEVDEVNLDK